jgi:hypothetical protein
MFFGNPLPTIRIDATLLSFSLAPPGGRRRTGKVRSKDLFSLGGLRKPLFHVCFLAPKSVPSGDGERRLASAK